MSDPGSDVTPARERLQAIADALGQPLEAFLAPSPDRLHLIELLELWARLTRDERDAALKLIRAMAENR